MSQQNIRMVAEVNKLIGNTLLKDGGLDLPNVGSLTIVTSTPKMASSTSPSVAPQRTIELSGEGKHIKLTSIIAERGNCTPRQAEQVYAKWLEMVSEEGVITITGVGTIRDGAFESMQPMENKLNPAIYKSEEQLNAEAALHNANKSKGDKKDGGSKRGYTYIICIIAAALVAGIYICIDRGVIDLAPKEPQVEVVAERVEEPQVAEKEPRVVEVEQKVEPKVEPKPEVEVKSVPAVKLVEAKKIYSKFAELNRAMELSDKSKDKPYKVACGVYSTEANANRAVVAVNKLLKPLSMECGVTYYGKNLLLTAFEGASEQECRVAMAQVKDLFKEPLWIYNKKK